MDSANYGKHSREVWKTYYQHFWPKWILKVNAN